MHFLAGVGTGGTLSGVGKVLKKEYPNVEIVAIEPEASPVLSGGEQALINYKDWEQVSYLIL